MQSVVKYAIGCSAQRLFERCDGCAAKGHTDATIYRISHRTTNCIMLHRKSSGYFANKRYNRQDNLHFNLVSPRVDNGTLILIHDPKKSSSIRNTLKISAKT